MASYYDEDYPNPCKGVTMSYNDHLPRYPHREKDFAMATYQKPFISSPPSQLKLFTTAGNQYFYWNDTRGAEL